MGNPTTPRTEGVDVANTPPSLVGDGEMTVAENDEKDVVHLERSLFNSILLVLAVTLVMIINVRVSLLVQRTF